MDNHDIQKSQHLLKRLEEDMNFLRNLLSQAEAVSSSLNGTWTAIRVTYTNWKRKMESDQ